MCSYLKWVDLGKLILSGLLVYWIYTSVGWPVTILAALVCTNDLFAGVVNRIKNERDKLRNMGIMALLDTTTRLLENQQETK